MLRGDIMLPGTIVYVAWDDHVAWDCVRFINARGRPDAKARGSKGL